MRKLLFVLLFIVACSTPPISAPVELEEYDGYVNEQFHFRNQILSGFDVLEGESGIFMSKPSQYLDNPGKKDEEIISYRIEIVVEAQEVQYLNLADFLMKEYDGYSVEYLDDGVIVDEWMDDDSVRHFYTMRGDVLYDAYFRLPSVRFNNHLSGFDAFLETLEFDF
ncbi:hypothetical protein JKY72_02785 [Candidatus Gracilibacteria bacterium]|nr:hypothetical protein [Candidatus Gracilibacteria bacterium]